VSKLAEQPFLVFTVVRRLFLLLAGMSFGLALIGSFAMVATDLAARRREFGIRLAVGATPLGILKTLLAKYVSVAIMTSLVTAVSFLWLRALVSRFVGAILIGWPAEQVGSWTWIAAGLVMLAVFATALMAFAGRQTGRLNPVILLKEE
jgi:putative ABC transport system permease protein